MNTTIDAGRSQRDSKSPATLTLRMNRKASAMIEVTATDIFSDSPERKVCLSIAAIHSFEKAKHWPADDQANVGTYVYVRDSRQVGLLDDPLLVVAESYDTLKALIQRAMREGLCDDGGCVMICPQCGAGHLVERTNRKNGATFWGCSAYPACKFAVASLDRLKPTEAAPKAASGPFPSTSNQELIAAINALTDAIRTLAGAKETTP